MGAQDGPHAMLWRSRYGSQSPTYLTRRTPPPPQPRPPTVSPTGWTASSGRAWRRLPTAVQWIATLAIFVGMQTVTPPAGVVFVVVLVIFLAITSPDVKPRPAATGKAPQPSHKEGTLASTTSIEAQVAGAASRAWDETRAEPAWSSPLLTATRESFDGDREVDAIIDLALRINDARLALGARPAGPAAPIWQQQVDALDQAALRLGERADALIRHRDQAAALSAELAQLDVLERLERSSVLVDDLTMETSAVASGSHGQLPVSDQIAATRAAVTDLIELMTRTLAPLTTPSEPPSAGTPLGGH